MLPSAGVKLMEVIVVEIVVNPKISPHFTKGSLVIAQGQNSLPTKKRGNKVDAQRQFSTFSHQ